MSTTASLAPEAPAAYGASAAEPARGLSISSLVIGIVSIAAGWTLIAPVAGLVLGIMALRREPAGRTLAIWGIVLNGLMLAGVVLFTAITVVFGLAFLPFAFLGM
ncbi:MULTISPECIES: hypothetical protein [unclassified Leifsonia]|uniref:hypothetical protein n=1 Tax=unclassified Leifsonia TaxID=2663824 RepID=UPI0006FE3EE5|nr:MULTISPECIES: hypothetical protein [unclassified Leifsonia]KQX06587.1 hypothetical protein ASC59_01625 [Leifsonia sp. Root1293]KRA10871.1 hypothetical protein ASD61_01625 [Leifsonia sp. Root60]